MSDKPMKHYKEDFEYACDELKRKDEELSILRKRVGEKNLEIAKLNKRVEQVALALAEWKCANILKRGVGLAMARYNTARAALRHAINGTTPQKRLCADFETTVAGIPCGVVITIYSGVRQWRQHTFSGAGPGDCDPPEYEDVEWRLVDSKDRKSTRLNSSHLTQSRMPSSA